MLLRAAIKPTLVCDDSDVVAHCFCDAKPRRDPTGTADIRRRLGSAAETRWRQVSTAVRQAISRDILALNPATVSPLGSGDTVHAFQAWLDNLMSKVVLGDGAWLRTVVAPAYVRAVARAQRLTKTSAVADDQTDVIDALHRMTIVEIQGVMEAVSQRLVRDAANAVLQGAKPAVVVRSMAEGIQAVGVTRSRAVIEIMVSKAFTHGTIDQFRLAGRTHVHVVPETVRKTTRAGDALIRDARGISGPGSRLKGAPSKSTLRRIRKGIAKLEGFGEVDVITAEDDDVCPECEDISLMGPYTLDEALTLIPAHPWCRCAYVPGDEFDTGEDGPISFPE